MNHDFLTRAQAAEYLQVRPETIDRWLKSGLLEGSQMVPRGAVRVSAVSVEKMLQKAKKKAQP